MPNRGYREIAEQLQAAIASGELVSGAPIASESELVRQHGVTRTTVRRALAHLEAGGLVTTVAGRGRFVRSTPGRGQEPLARFERVAEAVRRTVLDRPGASLGTEAAIAAEHGVSQGTARRALRELAAEGLVTAVPGSGWFGTGSGDAPTLTAKVAGEIRTALLRQEWAVGESIPGEIALARRFGVGRVTVRRALSVLQAEGLLNRSPGRGRLVCSGDSRLAIDN